YRKPRLDLERLASYSEGRFIVFSGHPGSELANCCFVDAKAAYNARTYDEAKGLVRPDWKRVVDDTIRKFQSLFGTNSFWVEIQLIDAARMPAALIISKILRDRAKRLGVPRVATADSHYPRRSDAPDQRVLLCSSLQTTMNQVQSKIELDEDFGMSGFFKSNNYHIPDLAEMRVLHEG